MSFYRTLIATVAALGLATSVFAADEASTQSTTDTTAIEKTTTTKTTATQVNLNTATAEELTKVNGLNKKRSEMIVKYRTDNGNFTSVDDLKKVKGLGLSMKQMKKVKSQLTIG